MGDPRRLKKKYKAPMHLWRKAMIESQRELCKKFGLKTKKEIWKIESKLKGFKDQAKKLTVAETAQAVKERDLLLQKLMRYGLLKKDSTLDDVLEIDIEAVLARRLQTLVFSLGLARSPKQARQFITHRHIMINGKKVSSPNYLVLVSEETMITFSQTSDLKDPEHPERKLTAVPEETPEEEDKEETKTAEEDKK